MKPSNDKEAITLILEGLIKAGCVVTKVNNHAEIIEYDGAAPLEEIIAEATATDDAFVYLTMPDGSSGAYVWFVLGNEPEEVACDHTINLSDYIDPIVKPWWG
jgi:hypothetical protein